LGGEVFSLQGQSTGSDSCVGVVDVSQPLLYQDLQGVTTITASLLNGEGPTGLALHQKTVVRVGDVITIDWWDYLDPQEYVLRGAKFTISYDFADPTKKSFSADGSYQVDSQAGTAHIVLPLASGQVIDQTVPWFPDSMTISDWPYHLHSKPLQVGQTYDFHVFYHEFLALGEDPFFTVHAEVTGTQQFPLDTSQGRRTCSVYLVKATYQHVPFKDPFFSAFLGPTPQLIAQALLTVDSGLILRYSTPFFRTSPAKSVGFSDFLLQL